MIKIETPEFPQEQNISYQNKNDNQIQNNNNPQQKKEEENSKVINPKEDISPEDQKKKAGKYKSLKFFKNLVIAPKNQATLKEVYKSLETIKNFEMSKLKYPPNFSDERLYMDKKDETKKVKHVNYPISAIGLLKCDYGNGLIIYGTGTLVALNMVLTCAHILYSPVLKKRCNKATFYLNGNF